MEFQFDMKLAHMALLKYALSLWNKGDMPVKLKQFYYPYGRQGIMPYLKDLANEIVNEIELGKMPESVRCDLIQVVNDVAFKTYDWFNFLRRKKIFRDQSRTQLYDIYLKDVSWTHFGTIDEYKIIKHSWLNTPNIDLTKLYVMACCFCFEDLIEELWGRIRFSISYDDLKSRLGFHLVVYWNKLRENRLEDLVDDCIAPLATDLQSVYNVNESVEVNMLKLSISKGFASAVKYFWDKLHDQERVDNLIHFLILALDEYSMKFNFEAYRKDNLSEIFLFLLNFATEEEKQDIFTRKKSVNTSSSVSDTCEYLSDVLQMTVKWPWKEFLFPIFDQVQNHLTEDVCVNYIRYLMEYSFNANKVLENRLIHFWNTVPNRLKNYIVSDGRLSSLFKKWDVIDINFILNDETVAHKRECIIKNMHSSVISLIRNKSYEKFYDFIYKVLVPSTWPVENQVVIKSLYESIIEGELNSENNLKILKSFSMEKIETIKRSIDPYTVCYYFVIENQLDLADEFLNWRFNVKEEITLFKYSFKANGFVKNHICYLWKTSKDDVEIVKSNSNDFLFWLLETRRDVVLFKMREIVPSIFDINESPCFDYENHIDVLDDFLSWNLLNEEAFEVFKSEVIRDNRLEVILTNSVKVGRFEEALKVCKWSFDSEEETYAYMREVLLSENGIMSCKLFISKYSSPKILYPQPDMEDLKAKFNDFIDFLSKPLNLAHLSYEFEDWARESNIFFEQIDNDAESTEEDKSELSDDECIVRPVYCERDRLALFLTLVNERIARAV